MIAALPLRGKQAKDALQRIFLRGIAGNGEGFFAGEFEEFAIAQRIGNVEAEFAGLAGAKEFAGAAKLQIGLGNFETVGGADHGFETSASFIGEARGRNEDAGGFLRAAADASAQLVKLGEAETLGMFDDHDGGVGNVDANFDDGGGDEDLHFIAAETLHDIVFFFAGEAAVQQANF